MSGLLQHRNSESSSKVGSLYRETKPTENSRGQDWPHEAVVRTEDLSLPLPPKPAAFPTVVNSFKEGLSVPFVLPKCMDSSVG